MKIKRVIIAVISLIYICFFALCCYSGPVRAGSAAASDAPAPVLPLLGSKKVSFSAGSFPADSTELTVVLQSGETSLLDQFTGLQAADLSGSTCYEEISAWTEKHPEVSVRYTVTLPGGVTADNSTESLSLPGLDNAGAQEAAALLKYLPSLKSIDLGSTSEGASLDVTAFAALREACPEAELLYSFEFLGRGLTLSDESVDLSGLLHEDAEAAAAVLACMPKLKYIDLGAEGNGSFTWDDIGLLQASCPNADVNFSFTLFGKPISLLDETLDFNHITMEDEGVAVRSILPYMKKCTRLDMDSCGVSNEAMAAIRNDYPDIKVIWRIWFGEAYSVRTDVEKILASKPSKGGTLNDAQVDVLKYCSDLKYLDLGHNQAICDLSFLYGTPNLEVLVIAMNPVSDITPMASCPKLEYIELNTTDVSDLTPLSGLTELRHLNIANCLNVTDISPLYGLTELERLWIGSLDPVPAEQITEMQACAPNCEINTEVSTDPTGGRWRIIGYTELSLQLYEETGWLQEVLHPRYELLREQFGYDQEAYSFYWNDPLY